MPNTFRSPILTFGDLIVTDGAVVEIDGDVRAKGIYPLEMTVKHIRVGGIWRHLCIPWR